jgi:hypothetical protein
VSQAFDRGKTFEVQIDFDEVGSSSHCALQLGPEMIPYQPSPTKLRRQNAKSMRLSHFLLLSTALFSCDALPVWSQSARQIQLVASKLTNDGTSFSLYAPLGRTYYINASPDLVTWSLVDNNIIGESVSYADANAGHLRQRYFNASYHWTMQLPNPYQLFYAASGRDGRVIAYPYFGWNTNQGTDGRLIAYPAGWSTNQGADGRLIAFPSGWTTTNGPDGRLVAFPPSGCATTNGVDGRARVHPAPGLAGTNAYVPAAWKWIAGGDGRLAAYPSSNFLTNAGGDGRLVAYESAGWSTNCGTDGHTVAFPATGYATAKWADGRVIAYPNSGWMTVQGTDGRTIAYPATGTPGIEVDFEDQELFALLGHLRTVLADPDFENYVIYEYFGTGEQRFVY